MASLEFTARSNRGISVRGGTSIRDPADDVPNFQTTGEIHGGYVRQDKFPRISKFRSTRYFHQKKQSIGKYPSNTGEKFIYAL